MHNNLPLVFLIILLSSLSVSGQYKNESFLLKGTINGVPDGTTIHLAPNNRKAADWSLNSDSSVILNGQFYFKGTIRYPHGVRFFYDAANTNFESKLFFLDKGVQTLTINIDSIKKYTPRIQGSKANSIYQKRFHVNEIEQEGVNLSEKAWQLYSQYKNEMPENEIMNFRKEKEEYNNKKDSILLKSTTVSNSYFISLWLAIDYLFSNGYKPQYQKIYTLLPDNIKKTKAGIFLKTRLAESGKTTIGAVFPMLNLFDRDSIAQSVAFNTEQAKYTLIDFWFSYCGPCIAQFAEFKEIYKLFPKEKFQIISISVDAKKDRAAWLGAIKKYELPWQHFWDPGVAEARRLSINSCPTTFLLGPDGKVIAKNMEPAELKEFLNKNL